MKVRIEDAVPGVWATGPRTQNSAGLWVPAVPLPFLGLLKRCRCGRRFWTLDGYRGHYAYAHILGMEERTA